MDRSKRNILITGVPGVGKTTLVRAIAAKLADYLPVGFYTAEIRERGARKGFELASLDGRRGVLSHVDIRGGPRVGRYGVDVEGFDRFIDAIQWFAPDSGLAVIDEIGKMECFSSKFQGLVRRLLQSDTPVLATTARKGSGLISEVKQRSDVELLELTSRNRDVIINEVAARFA